MNINTLKVFKRSYVLIAFSLVIFTIVHSQMPVLDGPWFLARLMIGVFGLIFLPGFILANIALDEKNVNIVSSLILGFMLQLLNIYVIWMLHIFYKPITFSLLMYIITIIEVAIFIVLCHTRGLILNLGKVLNKNVRDLALVLIIVLYLVLALYWQQWAPAPHSDGATYLDMARNVVNNGSFSSNTLYPNNSYSYVIFSSGMIEHMFGYFAIALFFMLGDISLFSAKIMLIFTGMLIIVLLYKLSERFFNVNVARLAALITAVSPLLLTYVGLVGGPELPSALFVLFTIYLLVCAPSSKRKISLALMAGVSLFIAWQAWYFNFFVALLFLPLLFIYIALKRKEFEFIDLLYLLLLLAAFILEYRVLLNFTYATTGLKIPSLFIVVFILVYFSRLKKSPSRNTLVSFALTFLALYLLMYSLESASIVIPHMQQFVASVQPGTEFFTSNVARDVGVLSRAFNIDEVNRYWSMYWDGAFGYLGVVVVFLALLSLARVNKLKETLILLSFPLLQAMWWSLLVNINAFQPRFIVCSSLFYFVLAASVIEMIYSHALANSNKANKLHVNLKVKIGKIAFFINAKSLVTTFVIVLLLASFLNFTYPIYDKNKKVMEGWNYPYNVGGSSAFEWISNNTSKDDVLMSRSASYFAWYTDRLVAWPPEDRNLNLTGLIDAIRLYGVKYLIIDKIWFYEYPNLSDLYTSPANFLGSKIAFISYYGEPKVVIYNVTNIAFGKLVREENIVDKGELLENWVPFTLYGNGSVRLDYVDKLEGNSSVKLTMTVKEQSNPSVALNFLPKQSLNLSEFTNIVISVKIPDGDKAELKLGSDSVNYFVAETGNLVFDKWFNLTFTLSNFKVKFGNPTLENINTVDFYLDGVQPNKTYDIWVGNIVAYREEYVAK